MLLELKAQNYRPGIIAHLEANIAGSQADQLHILLHQPGHNAQHQVCSLLVVQPPNEPNQRYLPGNTAVRPCRSCKSQSWTLQRPA